MSETFYSVAVLSLDSLPSYRDLRLWSLKSSIIVLDSAMTPRMIIWCVFDRRASSFSRFRPTLFPRNVEFRANKGRNDKLFLEIPLINMSNWLPQTRSTEYMASNLINLPGSSCQKHEITARLPILRNTQLWYRVRGMVFGLFFMKAQAGRGSGTAPIPEWIVFLHYSTKLCEEIPRTTSLAVEKWVSVGMLFASTQEGQDP